MASSAMRNFLRDSMELASGAERAEPKWTYFLTLLSGSEWSGHCKSRNAGKPDVGVFVRGNWGILVLRAMTPCNVFGACVLVF